MMGMINWNSKRQGRIIPKVDLNAQTVPSPVSAALLMHAYFAVWRPERTSVGGVRERTARLSI
jgi:hypothetical protein